MRRCLALLGPLLALLTACRAADDPAALPGAAPDPAALRGAVAPANGMWLEYLNLKFMDCGYHRPQVAKSIDGNPLRLGGVTYEHGVGTHAASDLTIDLKGVATRFCSLVGVDDEKKGAGSIEFIVEVDGKERYHSPVLHGGDAPQFVSVDLTGAKFMTLLVTDADDGINSDHADWAGAVLLLVPDTKPKPAAVVGMPVTAEPAPAIASGDGPTPAIHGPRVVGATPGCDFLWLIPATGEGPLTYAAVGLPAGLSLDARTGIISGRLAAAGETDVTLTVSGPRGQATRRVKVIAGRWKLAQTPPLGWNSWNVWAGNVSDQHVREAIDAMVASGLAAHGFAYVNLDDCWEGPRDANGEITTNKRFPDMKALADYAHSKGLKLGIYSSPGPKTCAGYPGSYEHEAQDAKTWAKWGIDYVKYDWCSYGNVASGEGHERFLKPYRVMREALDACGRDIVFSYCQYGMDKVWEWGAAAGGNCWRTTGDITDNWKSMSSIGFSQDGHEKFAGPGHWNDPDMLVVGRVGWGRSRPTGLTANEQLTHISLWCLQSAPLLLGCDMAQLDKFTIDLLTNDEVLDVNQDPLGQPAGRKVRNGTTQVWARPLADGTQAVGLFNLGREGADVQVSLADLGLTGEQPVRDLWARQDRGKCAGTYRTRVPAHGVVLLKIGTQRPLP